MAEERDLQSDCIEFAEALDGEMINVKSISSTGFPDTLLVLPGCRTVYVELKAKSGRQSKKQKWWQERLEKLGQSYWLIDDLEEFMDRCLDHYVEMGVITKWKRN